jgi:hypothetical protein
MQLCMLGGRSYSALITRGEKKNGDHPNVTARLAVAGFAAIFM